MILPINRSLIGADDDERAVITDGLRAYNETQTGGSDGRPLAILVRNPETKMVAGGLLGRTYLGLLTVERFFFCSRCNRLGCWILAMAEKEARRRECTRAALSTLHFQAPGFYLKRGWEVAARAARPRAVLYDQEAVLNTAARPCSGQRWFATDSSVEGHKDSNPRSP